MVKDKLYKSRQYKSAMQIKETIFKVIIKPNAAKNEVVGFDSDKKAYKKVKEQFAASFKKKASW